MKHMKTYFLLSILVLLLGVTGTAFADFSATDWQFMRPIDLSSVAMPGTYVKLNVDRAVSAKASPSLADLRIVTGDGEEVPYQLVIEDEQVRQEYVKSTLRDLSTQNGETMFILDLGSSGTIHDHLLVSTVSKNFKRPVSVYASDTATEHGDRDWRLLSDKSYIYNFYDRALGFDAGSKDIYYPESTSRYLRVVIGRGEGSDVAVDGSKVLRVLERDAKKNRMREHASVAQNAKEKSTELTVDLGASGVATRKITLATDERYNFSRRVVIQGSNDAASWTLLGQGYVFLLDTPLFSGSDLSVSYPESKMRYIRAVVFNEDNKPVAWSNTVVMEGVARAIVFATRSGFATHVLYYGNSKANAPRYDIARFFQYVEGTTLPEVMLGGEIMNTAYIPPTPPVVPFSERNDNVLNGVLVLLVAAVSMLLISHLKKLKLSSRGPK
jgi:hypothetical protein